MVGFTPNSLPCTLYDYVAQEKESCPLLVVSGCWLVNSIFKVLYISGGDCRISEPSTE